MPKRGAKQDPQMVKDALRTSLSPLMRQLRKFGALCACVEVLESALDATPAELAALAAPYDVRLAPARETIQTEGLADVTTLYVYVASRTVETALEQQKKRLIAEINRRLPLAVVEELRYEVAPPAKIARQLNILALTPD